PLLRGGTLRDRLRKGRLGVDETWKLGRELATSIGWAHERGIVHRDLKPENVLFDDRGRPLISDLGIAKHLVELHSTSAEELTKAGVFLGTLGYMAPEQIDCARNVTASADVFSLGVILYECLTGTAPFEGRTIGERFVRALEARHVPLSEARPDLPLSLSNAISVALLRKPEERHGDGFAFAQALGAEIPRASAISTTADESPAKAEHRARSHLPWIAGLAVLVLGAVFAAWRAMPSPQQRPVVPQAPKAVPKAPVVVAKGWFDDPMPPGLRKAAERPLYIFDTGRGLELAFVHVPAGDFMMGAINGAPHEKPIHTHSMPRSYYIGRTEVTWREYLAFCRSSGHSEPARPAWEVTEDHPVVNVSWDDAQAFCEWAHVVLPSEAEWEKAARGTDWRQWPWGNEWLPGRANILDASCPEPGIPGAKEAESDGFPYTAAVGSLPDGASPYGALDMAGNAREWCADWFDPGIYQEYSNGRTEPPATGTERVQRGGDWANSRFTAATTFRIHGFPNGASDRFGFRVCLRPAR
ncbi:MAG TPA: bifunctional serine/threonine-protein kinase/formylglycine-generating enzyme family protein, partial [Planctomycetota bacterium]|nr:bifunctional serine/threonine-protein kinase/formylglycine-generating enzyme family protein [Planctomycetota bacterium]